MKACFCATLLLMPHAAGADMATARDHFENRRFEAARAALHPLSLAGVAEAELMLGDLYSLGLVEPSHERAALFWHRAALKGHPLAQLRLSRAYSDGAGVPVDPLQAALWAQLASIGGAPFAEDAATEAKAALDAGQRETLRHLLGDLKPYLYPLAD